MALSANPKISSHEQVEYELGLLVDNGAPVEAVYHTTSLSEFPPVEQRKPPLSEPAKIYVQAVGGRRVELGR